MENEVECLFFCTINPFPSNVRQQIKSEGRTIICQSCGGITSHEDSFDKRHIEHQRGKGHAAMEYLRNRFAEIKTKAIQQKDDWKEEKKISQSRSVIYFNEYNSLLFLWGNSNHTEIDPSSLKY